LNKELILQACKEILSKKKSVIKAAITEIQESMLNETKSSSGDKHETARAKMQSEQEKLENQLYALENQWQVLEKININQISQSIIAGSLVQTQDAYFFIAVGLGKISVEEVNVFVISPNSPIGKQFIGLKKGEQFELNGTKYIILSIV
jgi:transcription elongation GreA/GreB family factor